MYWIGGKEENVDDDDEEDAKKRISAIVSETRLTVIVRIEKKWKSFYRHREKTMHKILWKRNNALMFKAQQKIF